MPLNEKGDAPATGSAPDFERNLQNLAKLFVTESMKPIPNVNEIRAVFAAATDAAIAEAAERANGPFDFNGPGKSVGLHAFTTAHLTPFIYNNTENGSDWPDASDGEQRGPSWRPSLPSDAQSLTGSPKVDVGDRAASDATASAKAKSVTEKDAADKTAAEKKGTAE